MKCQKCGYENSEQARYCGSCGNALTNREDNHANHTSSKIPSIALTLCVMAVVAALGILLFTRGNSNGYGVCSHMWSESSCTQPQKCKICGLESGSPRGHQWINATCTSPKTCSKCGATEGSTKEHQWIDATCTSPMFCSTCGATWGSAKSHSWVAATHTAPKTCSVCGETEGSQLARPNISVADRVNWIADEYRLVEYARENDLLERHKIRDGYSHYYDQNGEIRMVVVASGNDGLGAYSNQYRRYYYFANGELFFAYYEGQDFHRLYFYEGELMRWKYQGVGKTKAEAVVEDFSYSDGFLKWEKLALDEVDSFGVV